MHQVHQHYSYTGIHDIQNLDSIGVPCVQRKSARLESTFDINLYDTVRGHPELLCRLCFYPHGLHQDQKSGNDSKQWQQ
jgi:hypothetical protein